MSSFLDLSLKKEEPLSKAAILKNPSIEESHIAQALLKYSVLRVRQ